MELFYPWNVINAAHDDKYICEQRDFIRAIFREREQEAFLTSTSEVCTVPSGEALHYTVSMKLIDLRYTLNYRLRTLEWEQRPELLVELLNKIVITVLGCVRVMTDRHQAFIEPEMRARISERCECFLEELDRKVSEICPGSALQRQIAWTGAAYVLREAPKPCE